MLCNAEVGKRSYEFNVFYLVMQEFLIQSLNRF